jgi:hypothetical protein
MSIPPKFGLSISVFQITSLDQQYEEMRVPARPITSGGSRTSARDAGKRLINLRDHPGVKDALGLMTRHQKSSEKALYAMEVSSRRVNAQVKEPFTRSSASA